MINFEKALKEFHDMIGDKYPDEPTILTPLEYMQRDNIEEEERDEFFAAWDTGKPLSAQAKEQTDKLYTVLGTMVKMGLPIPECFAEVHRSKMTEKDGHMNEHGKWIKPDNYEPADMEKILHVPVKIHYKSKYGRLSFRCKITNVCRVGSEACKMCYRCHSYNFDQHWIRCKANPTADPSKWSEE